MRLRLDNASTAATLNVHTPVEALLSATPGAGATWRVAISPAAIRVEKRGAEANTAAPGSAVDQVFVVTADAPGDYVVTFVYGRPWEPIVRETRELKLRVEIA